MSTFNGIILLDKEAGITSAGAVNAVKRLLPRGTKIGHAGTLDPFATGLVLLLVGKATKRCEALMDSPKEYFATIRFGATTETDDPESPPQFVDGATAPDEGQLLDVLSRFSGDIEQIPPAYSALKIAGRRACDRIRAGQSVVLKPRIVHVYATTLMKYAWPDAEVRINCGRGTYIRAIARDVGNLLKVGGYLTTLRRTKTGSFEIEGASTLDVLRRDGVEPHLIEVPPIVENPPA